MRTRAKLIIPLAAGVMSGFAYAQVPAFEDCPAPVEEKRTIPRVKFADAQGRQFRTVIRNAAKGSVNFAGHYILATWGCGAGCVMAAAIDVKSGLATSLPFTVSGWPLDVTEPLSFRQDSCLLVVQGSRNESIEHGTYYYMFDGKTFTLRATEHASQP